MDDSVRRKIEELHLAFLEWHSKYGVKNPDIAGFNMPYSPASTWGGDNGTLLLTINPKAQDHKESEGPNARKREFVPETVWPDDNEFYSRKFTRQVFFQRAAEQIAKALGDPPDKPRTSYAMWSAVPYRTEKESQLPQWCWEDARRKVWGPIFKLWQPANIFAFGKETYPAIRDALAMSARLESEKAEKGDGYYYQATGKTPKRSPYFKYAQFRSAQGKEINLFGLPHPSQYHYYYEGDLSAAARFIMAIRERKQAS